MVAIRHTRIAPAGMPFAPGTWIDVSRNIVGNDLTELVAYLNGKTYSESLQMLAGHLDTTAASAKFSSSWIQERNPLRTDLLPIPLVSSHLYQNEYGDPIMISKGDICQNGEMAILYFTIWRNKRTGEMVVLEAFPEHPLPMYNSDFLSKYLDTPVYIVTDETTARACLSSRFISSAVPGGIANIPFADLRLLKGRIVGVQMVEQSFPYIQRIVHALKAAGVQEVRFRLDESQTEMSVDEAERLAARKEVNQLPLINGERSSVSLKAVNALTLRDMPLKPRGHVLEPIILTQGLVMLCAHRGVGKSHVALGMAVACATGSTFLAYGAPKPVRVLFVDGEMAVTELQARIKVMPNSSDAALGENLHIITPDLVDGVMPDIATEEGQKALEPLIDKCSLLVLDNLATLCRSGNQNTGEGWNSIQRWLLELRRRGKSVLIVHHTGKDGKQRGTSQREDALDVAMILRRPV